MNKEKLMNDLEELKKEFMKEYFKYPSDVDSMIIHLAMVKAVNLVVDMFLEESRMETFNLMRKG